MAAIIPQSLESEINIRVSKIAESLKKQNVDAILLGSLQMSIMRRAEYFRVMHI